MVRGLRVPKRKAVYYVVEPSQLTRYRVSSGSECVFRLHSEPHILLFFPEPIKQKNSTQQPWCNTISVKENVNEECFQMEPERHTHLCTILLIP